MNARNRNETLEILNHGRRIAQVSHKSQTLIRLFIQDSRGNF